MSINSNVAKKLLISCKSFFKRMSINSNVAKKTNPVETTVSAEVPSEPSRSTETEIVNEKLN